MTSESQIPIDTQVASRRFATRIALFYGTLFGLVGTHLPFFPVWLIASVAGLGALASLTLQPLDKPTISVATPHDARALLRDGGFVAIIVTSALIQASHAAYYTFASIAWQQAGFGGLTIAGLWVLGVLAEIVLFALSPRFRLPFSLLVVIAALSAGLRWLITARSPHIAYLAAVHLVRRPGIGTNLAC